MQIGNPPVAYIDGGLGYNNLIRVLMEEKSHIWPDRQVGCIVSIGTGIPVSRDFGGTVKPLFDKLREIATDTEKVAREFEEEIKYKHGNEQKAYFRFNVQQGLEQVGLQEWKEMERINVATRDYLKSHWSRVEASPAILVRNEDTKLKHYNATTEEVECLQSLCPKGIDYESQKDQNPKRVPNTCLWTLENPKYTLWRDSNVKKLLWISADPGCGKSHPQLIRHALPKYRERGAALSTTLPELWSIFITAIADPTAGNVVCVFDALDESSNNIELAGNDESASIKKEIDYVIEYKVTSLKREDRLSQEVIDYLKKRLSEIEHRTYLWLHLLWKIIQKTLSGIKSELDRLIDNLPNDIQESYEILLEKSPDRHFTKKVLQIVLTAARPLTLVEIDVALHINEKTLSYTKLELEGPDRLRETLLSRCGLIVSIIQDKVYFIY
ncbi:MAG: hypothetical protein LQ342_008396 [Letrouitia transgressa]|nr:MAG: hypothetical protein LQ342_008396 [Letrouitia transgressa]